MKQKGKDVEALAKDLRIASGKLAAAEKSLKDRCLHNPKLPIPTFFVMKFNNTFNPSPCDRLQRSVVIASRRSASLAAGLAMS